MRFLVVIATIRQRLPGFDETMDRIRSTFEFETDFHILDGSEGKAQALNLARRELLASTDAACYVTMDDDIIPGAGWQALMEEAFQQLPKFGAFGLWMGDDPASLELHGAHLLDPDRRVGNVVYRRVRPPHHLNGGFIAYRTEVARLIGDIPTEGVRYQLWEDAWRGRTVTKLGWEMAHLKGPRSEVIEYPDTGEYVAQKAAETKFGKQRSDVLLAEEGLGDSLLLRLRKWVARIRGRAK